ncbi:MarP family serine protease [Mumia zhuanghuii]|uniref:MarP family serine protease n=1 Tax=Mumia zhuanghuii TaxID=2585211 RepID=A0A5C4MWP0_9ACTN|nr:MarP family serine protease [Mumia zhuanghuii]TNC49718.1 MarP family serine protease [Mumia zhuanghuii]TNC49977.1 MarP family serine protease [Mumia zhuanghuii]
MNPIDVVVVLVVISYAVLGYLRGFVAGAFAMAGLLLGGVVGLIASPMLLSSMEHGTGRSLLAVVIVLVLASAGQATGSHLGTRLRARVTHPPARSIDAVGGVALSALASLVVCWALGYAVSGSQIPGASTAVRGSKVLASVDSAMPQGVRGALHSFDTVVDATLFPRYLEPFTPETIKPAAAPDPAVLQRPEVTSARRSVARITGQAVCNRGLEGSGFVYAKERVMTNAHVVAGVAQPSVALRGETYDATVVYYDPSLDIAVLRVPGLRARALAFDPDAAQGQSAAVLGYPENGPFDARAARIRSEQRLRSPDIYGTTQVVREVYALRALVRSGNSGGPVISEQGRVVGVVFAASIADSSTGYALTAGQVGGAARAGVRALRPVDTGNCA